MGDTLAVIALGSIIGLLLFFPVRAIILESKLPRDWRVTEFLECRTISDEMREFDVFEKASCGAQRTTTFLRRGPYPGRNASEITWFRLPDYTEYHNGARIRLMWEHAEAREKADDATIAGA